MIRKLILLSLSILMITAPAEAGKLMLSQMPAGVAGIDQSGSAVWNFSPMIQKVGYYCRRDCTYCRNDCYNAYRINCYGPGCRPSFVLCMRSCWENICRNC